MAGPGFNGRPVFRYARNWVEPQFLDRAGMEEREWSPSATEGKHAGCEVGDAKDAAPPRAPGS